MRKRGLRRTKDWPGPDWARSLVFVASARGSAISKKVASEPTHPPLPSLVLPHPSFPFSSISPFFLPPSPLRSFYLSYSTSILLFSNTFQGNHSSMVHRPTDSRLLQNLISHEKDYTKQLAALSSASQLSLSSFSAYASASSPSISRTLIAVAGSLAGADDALRRYGEAVEVWREHLVRLKELEDDVGNIMRDREILCVLEIFYSIFAVLMLIFVV